ncbi:protease 2 [Asticcacaulis biprosthecium C19]|uniref:Protease 2 n=1 Tax=Asticcacaulis biprosthecium C19 TaxID=715226 RepID=F4QPS1_9CAUL|nr:oligopeptidase B [Asticcacaulis biprosthecium]EGF90208.1 protease 2 [Asticcacaulis biprosthecium C19]
MRMILMTAAALLAFPAVAAEPPVAKKVPYEVKAPFGAARNDDYYWLRDDTRKNEEMLAYLRAENAYADTVLADSKPLAESLYKEVTARLVPDDSSVPYLKGGYWYYTRFVAGKDYAVVARRKGEMTAPEEVLLDQNAMAEGNGYFRVGAWAVSPDKTKIAWAEDTIGRGQYGLKVKDIATGAMLDAAVSNIEDIAWSDDNTTIYYIDKDPVTLLSKRVKAHSIGSEANADRLVYEEADDSYYISLGRTTSDKYVCINLHATVSDEQRCAPAGGGEFAVIAPRQRDFLYTADHVTGRWVIRTNWHAKNYRLMTQADSLGFGDRSTWTDLVPVSDDAFIENFQPFDGFVAIEERVGGNKRLRLLTCAGVSTPVQSDEPAYVMGLNVNPDPASDWVRYAYGSLTTPDTIYETNVRTGERRTLKVQPVPGYDASQYVTERVWATARDGTKIPVSLVYKKGFKKDGTAAVYQIAYGAYGSSSDPSFNPMFPSLLERGMVVAIAHIRGGQEMGRQWYDDGHLMKKMNSFTDFIDVTRYLVGQKYAAPKRVAGFGRSAGGLLMGAVANMAPQDYGFIVTQVPFVDAVTTMLDASIPLTTNEYDEWGNPEQKPFYDYMMTYSPYDNVTAQAYPPIYVSTGLWDSQVQYYEPTKWVAKLRRLKTGDAPLVYRVNMEAGHGGKSGRFRRWEELSEAMAFMMQQLKVE